MVVGVKGSLRSLQFELAFFPQTVSESLIYPLGDFLRICLGLRCDCDKYAQGLAEFQRPFLTCEVKAIV